MIKPTKDESLGILYILSRATIDEGSALTSSQASMYLSMAGYTKSRFKVQRLSDILETIPGVKVVPALYKGGVTVIVIEELAKMDKSFGSSITAKKSAKNRVSFLMYEQPGSGERLILDRVVRSHDSERTFMAPTYFNSKAATIH